VERAKAKGFLAIEGDVIGAVRSFPDAQFGIVCATELIEHLDEEYRGELLSEAFRVVYPGGYLLLSTPNRMSPDGLYGYYYRELIRGVRYTAWDDTHNRIYSSFEIRNALKRAGWQIARTVGYHYGSHGVSLPIEASDHFPLNRFGFDTMVLCRRAD
jgi:2-polyprenyl-3-methyl-5-hydroxy-6-metoxy-1,4-benzoquinol methylase